MAFTARQSNKSRGRRMLKLRCHGDHFSHSHREYTTSAAQQVRDRWLVSCRRKNRSIIVANASSELCLSQNSITRDWIQPASFTGFWKGDVGLKSLGTEHSAGLRAEHLVRDYGPSYPQYFWLSDNLQFRLCTIYLELSAWTHSPYW